MEWLKIPLDPNWEIDGKSRLQHITKTQMCDLSATLPAILLTGAYAFNAEDAEDINDIDQLKFDKCFSRTTDTGRFHYQVWSPCVSPDGIASTTSAPGLCST